jgi:hypothetical protein
VPIPFGLIILGKHVCPNKDEREKRSPSFNSLASVVTSSKDRLNGPILFGLIILGKHVCTNKVEKERSL